MPMPGQGAVWDCGRLHGPCRVKWQDIVGLAERAEEVTTNSLRYKAGWRTSEGRLVTKMTGGWSERRRLCLCFP
jgi:hypothetical protein